MPKSATSPETWETPGAGDRIGNYVDRYADACIVLDEAEEAAKAARATKERLEDELFTLLEAEGVRQVRHARGLFTMNDLAWASVEDEAAAREWAEQSMPEIITLNRQRLAVVVRTALRESQPLPPGVTFTTSRKVTWRRT